MMSKDNKKSWRFVIMCSSFFFSFFFGLLKKRALSSFNICLNFPFLMDSPIVFCTALWIIDVSYK